MSPEDFIQMMNELPDAVIDAANAPPVRQSRKLLYTVSALAACLLIGIAFAVYPKLHTQPPETVPPQVQTSDTAAAVTTASTTAGMTTASVYAAATEAVHTSRTETAAPEQTNALTAAAESNEPVFTTVPQTEPTQTQAPLTSALTGSSTSAATVRETIQTDFTEYQGEGFPDNPTVEDTRELEYTTVFTENTGRPENTTLTESTTECTTTIADEPEFSSSVMPLLLSVRLYPLF